MLLDKFKKFFSKQPTWQDIERFEPSWQDRISLMAQHIHSDDQSVLDIGCGPMWLKKYLPDGVLYIGLDYISRGEECIVCDLNVENLPPVSAHTFFISGCLEYILDTEKFIKSVSESAKKVIISYCALDDFSELREREIRGWKNHLYIAELIDSFEHKGMRLKSKEYSKENNVILVFLRSTSTI